MALINAKIIADCEQQALDSLEPWLSKGDRAGATEYCLRDGVVITNDTRQALINFFLILWILEHRGYDLTNKTIGIDDLVATAEGFLRTCKIRPSVSRFDGLYGRLYRALSMAHAHRGDPWRALWQATIGGTLLTKENEAEQRLFEADRALCLGYIDSAASTFLQCEADSHAPEHLAAARIGRVLCHKFAGDLQQAVSIAADIPAGLPEDHELRLEFAWQARFAEALITRNPALLLEAADARSPFYSARWALKASLVTFALGRENSSRQLKRASTLKASFAEIARGSYEFELHKMLLALEALQDDTVNINERLKRLGEDINRARNLGVIEDNLIFLAACTRWLHAVKQPRFANVLSQEYTGTCLRLSNGRSSDVLNLLSDLAATQSSFVAPAPSLASIPTNTGSLFLKLSGMAAHLGMMHLKQGLKNTFQANAVTIEERTRFLQEVMSYVIGELGTFKGPLMKFAQVLSGIQELPPESRLKLQESLGSTRSVSPDVFLRVFKSEIGKGVDEVFRRFDRNPIGVGSMGQVFRAELMDGREVAVKIHYPGLEKAVHSYAAIQRLCMIPLRQLLPRVDVLTTANLILQCFLDECDMEKEAAKHREIQEIYRDHPDIVVPQLIPELLSKSVLVTEYFPALRLFEFLPHASQDEKLRFYRLTERHIQECAGRHGWLQLDPHGGNYLYYQGKIVFLDFGSMLKIAPTARRAYAEIAEAIFDGDLDRVWKCHIEHGIYDANYITREFFDDVLARIVMQDWHPRFDPNRCHPSHFVNLLSDERLRLGTTSSPEIALWFFASFFLASMRQTMGIGVDEPPVLLAAS